MRKLIILVLAVVCSTVTFAQEAERFGLKAVNFGVGLPIECRDLKAAGLNVHIGYDYAYPVSDQLAVGFYLNGSAGFVGEFQRYSTEDHVHMMLRLSAGLMMEIGDRANRPYLLGVAPCTGFGLYDMDFVLPIELRFGRFLDDHWYVMGELTYGISLANETATIEPAIRVGYNFGIKPKEKKK